ncbi:hypothetical protein D3C81_1571390 [compost metagenome]
MIADQVERSHKALPHHTICAEHFRQSGTVRLEGVCDKVAEGDEAHGRNHQAGVGVLRFAVGDGACDVAPQCGIYRVHCQGAPTSVVTIYPRGNAPPGFSFCSRAGKSTARR